jgi:hypothetical protein
MDCVFAHPVRLLLTEEMIDDSAAGHSQNDEVPEPPHGMITVPFALNRRTIPDGAQRK